MENRLLWAEETGGSWGLRRLRGEMMALTRESSDTAVGTGTNRYSVRDHLGARWVTVSPGAWTGPLCPGLSAPHHHLVGDCHFCKGPCISLSFPDSQLHVWAFSFPQEPPHSCSYPAGQASHLPVLPAPLVMTF